MSDGLFWTGGTTWDGLDRALVSGQEDHDANLEVGDGCLVEPGEEWVELDDAGQPVEAKPVRMWVVRKVAGGPYFSRRFSESGEGHRWITDASLARMWPTREACEGLCERDEVPVPILVHPDGTVTLDEPARPLPDLTASPCWGKPIAQPSPYSEDEPIPYKLTEPDKTKRDRLIAEIAVHYAKASRHVRMASKKSRKLERLDARGGK